jgi:hypothetical protein
MPTFDPTDPLALVAAMSIAIAVLWRAHAAADADMRAQRDLAVSGWQAQTAATRDLAVAIEQRNRRDAAQVRAGDEA